VVRPFNLIRVESLLTLVGLGETVSGATGGAGKDVGKGIADVGNGVEDGGSRVSQGAKDAGEWKS